MEKKKKHSIIWLIIIVLAIATIVMITIAGAKKGETTAYAAETTITTEPEVLEDSASPNQTTGIDSITVEGSGTNIEPAQELYLEWTQNSDSEGNQGRAVVTTIQDLTAGEYTVKIAFIGDPLRATAGGTYENIGIGFINNNSQTAHYITKNDAGITEDSYQINITTTTNQFYINWFYNNSGAIQSGTYWINILQLQIINNSGNSIVNYESYLYNYLQGQFENANSDGYNDGYQNGMANGESLYRNNPFNGASLISVITEENTYQINNVGLNILSNGVAFTSINQAVDKYFQTKKIYHQNYTVKLKTIPFLLQENKLFISMNNGFYSLYFTDKDGNNYQIEQSNEKNNEGWYYLTAINNNAYGKEIEEIEITFANTDYVGTLYVSQTATQESAYNEGYNKGYNNGYQEGYNDSTIDGNGPAWSIKKLISTVSAGLNVDLIGEISLGDLLNVALGILLTFAVIRFFGGG